ncbi:hypothetical protein OH782_41615 (plasmid) [Streptomyces sp. NBC_01544]|uniref:hypothetical protein n=1 Tax=Streptomyces sp. NBC_01544 TaxID=2975871 RepID=UPI002F908EE6
MSPRPSKDVRAELKKEVEAALRQRADRRDEADRLKEEAEAEFWRAIDVLRQRYHGAQTDIVQVTQYTRDHIAKQSKRYAADPQDGDNGDQR